MFRKLSSRKRLMAALLAAGIAAELFLVFLLAYPVLIGSPAALIEIKSDSMLPAIRTGDFVLLGGADPEPDSLVGQVIAFYDPVRGRIIVHRAIGRSGDCYVTKGDNSDSADFFEPCRNYMLGRVIYPKT
jgi:signal peptidase I